MESMEEKALARVPFILPFQLSDVLGLRQSTQHVRAHPKQHPKNGQCGLASRDLNQNLKDSFKKGYISRAVKFFFGMEL
jgi:hypothetical protein